MQLVPDPPRPLRAIAEKARHADPGRRYQTVDGLAADLARFRDQEPVEAYRESLVERAIRVYRRYELPILLMLAYVVMRFVLLVWARNLNLGCEGCLRCLGCQRVGAKGANCAKGAWCQRRTSCGADVEEILQETE